MELLLIARGHGFLKQLNVLTIFYDFNSLIIVPEVCNSVIVIMLIEIVIFYIIFKRIFFW